ncbi:MAG: TetR/AcrR family transcriptional regulator [Methanomassiliicoccus sp.]|nr:TetR/AcrR family transcriptional regulator [Methanomassiliicoccus sp.]
MTNNIHGRLFIDKNDCNYYHSRVDTGEQLTMGRKIESIITKVREDKGRGRLVGLNEQRRNETTDRIICVSKELFARNGYAKTTTRQIAEAAGILNGSLFHLFPTKEDILKGVMVSIYNDALEEAEQYLKGNKDIIITVGYPAALELYAAYKDHRASELLFEAHSSWKVMNGLVDRSIDWMESRLNGFASDEEKERYRLDYIIIWGCLCALISECYHGQPRGFDPALRSILKVICSLNDISVEDADSVDAELIEILRNGKTVISKFDFK